MQKTGKIENRNDADIRIILRKKIVTCALQMFFKRGIKDVTMDEISAKLSISKRTLYEIFQDKENLLIACMQQNHLKMDKMFVQVIKNSSNVLEIILRAYSVRYKALHNVNPKFYQEIIFYPKVRAMIEKKKVRDYNNSITFFQRGVQEGIFREDINFELFAFILREQMQELAKNEKWRKFSFFDVLDFIIFTLFRGISTSRGVDIIDDFVNNTHKSEIKK